jgi:hypothetical protein
MIFSFFPSTYSKSKRANESNSRDQTTHLSWGDFLIARQAGE